MNQRYSVIPRTMCFIFYQDEVLLLKAARRKDWAGLYDPVGGHIEKGEDILESAKREIQEETGLRLNTIKLCGILHVVNFYQKDIMLYVCCAPSMTKNVIENDEGSLEWVKVSEIDNLPIFEDLKLILHKVLDLRPGQIFMGKSEFTDDNSLKSIEIAVHELLSFHQPVLSEKPF